MVLCRTCPARYNDVTRSTACPHPPLPQYAEQLAPTPPPAPARPLGWSPSARARVILEGGQAVAAGPADDPALVRGLDTLPDL